MPRQHQTCCICNKTIQILSSSRPITPQQQHRLQAFASRPITPGTDRCHHKCYVSPHTNKEKQVWHVDFNYLIACAYASHVAPQMHPSPTIEVVMPCSQMYICMYVCRCNHGQAWEYGTMVIWNTSMRFMIM